MYKRAFGLTAAMLMLLLFVLSAHAWTPLPVKDDPLVRMPGSQPQPEGNVSLEAPTRCLNCHAGYNQAVEPGYNWKGSMMAQAARDFIYWSCLTVAAQDSIWAVGRPNATDICLRCHMPKGWLEGRSDPTNGELMTSADFDGVQCDFCHTMFDPLFEGTHTGAREGDDWLHYWDETNASSTPSNIAANETYNEDLLQSQSILQFDGTTAFYNATTHYPFSSGYMENGSGQYFVSTGSEKRASFSDAAARHRMLYSRYHKSRYFCSACHDVSNPVLGNLGWDGASPLRTETDSASSFYHVERTFSEFMLSAYGQQGGAPGIGPFAPDVFETSYANNNIAKCQDCHMRDVVGQGCNKHGVPTRPDGSVEHPESGQPLHDLTGGNAWVSYVLASAVPGSPNYDAVNDSLLNQGANVLTLDLIQGEGIDPVALLAGAERAKQQLQLAASIQNLTYDATTGNLSFRIQNQTGHKLISGFPEGRRMFVNIRFYSGSTLLKEVNPYDYTAGTLKGLPASPLLADNEEYVDQLVYEMHPTSSLTGETETFHFALATGRHKDNRIPPRGFRIGEADSRLSTPVYYVNGVNIGAGYFTTAEYAGGYDDITLADYGISVQDADYVEVNLYYQTTSREYIEFLRDEINGDANTLGDNNAYIIQTDPFFDRLKAWGDTIWQLWTHNMNVDGATPFLMAKASNGTTPEPPPAQCETPGTPQNLSAASGRKSVDLSWEPGDPAPATGGYNIYYDQAGKYQLLDTVDSNTTSYTDRRLNRATTYCYSVTAWNDCNGNGVYDVDDAESAYTPTVCTTTQ